LAIDPVLADALHQKGRALMELNRGDEALVRLGATDTTPPSGDIVTAAATGPSE